MFDEGVGQTKVKCATEGCTKAALIDSKYCNPCHLADIKKDIKSIVDNLKSQLASATEERDYYLKEFKRFVLDNAELAKHSLGIAEECNLAKKALKKRILLSESPCEILCEKMTCGSRECIDLHVKNVREFEDYNTTQNEQEGR